MRIASVKSTRKITSAMKMVAASKLRQAQSRAEQSQPYARAMNEAMARLLKAIGSRQQKIPLLDGTGKSQNILMIVVSADRGLCGGFNSNIVREARRKINGLLLDNKQVRILCIGKKGRDLLRRDFRELIIDDRPLSRDFADAHEITKLLVAMFAAGSCDEVHVAYSQFKNVITQTPAVKQLVPYQVSNTAVQQLETQERQAAAQGFAAGIYKFEPNAMALLEAMVPQMVASELYRVQLEVGAGEQAARMTAMDNATRNAGDMINGLSLTYNRARQAAITREVVEIISGAEATANKAA
jgi:F-type H+-transporting ATPase subunit gamma